jgi:prefoldin alpha subunit
MDREKMIELQMLGQQIEQIQGYLQNMDGQIDAITQVLTHLDEVNDLKGDEDVLIPLTNGIFLKGKLSDKDTLLVNVGAETVVEKTLGQTKTLLESQKNDIEKYKADALVQVQELFTRFTELQGDLKRG